jgi:uncharacterized protein (TIGR03067 family)
MLAAALVFVLAAPADPPKEKEKELPAEAKKELKKLEGKWRLVKAADANKESDVKESEALVFEFKGAEMTMSFGEKKETIRVAAIDSTTDPKCIDFIEVRKDKTERTLEGVYKLDGDTLKIALSIPKEGKNRPTSFDKPTDSRAMVWTLKRVKE